MSTINLEEILQQFNLSADIEPYGNGHINDTFLVTPKKYILQRINISIFKNPDELMDTADFSSPHSPARGIILTMCGGKIVYRA